MDVKQPTPVVRIDNQSDTFATIVSVQYGDKLGELLETVRPCLHVWCRGHSGELLEMESCKCGFVWTHEPTLWG